ncbi:hypothetical protein ACFC1R_33105 [Kitasatospora sp. NPDC056138]|uniref:hypothetical protein n=1 Tax=Kitasatospora sp. NPDC056138 TaxID=3345724 RepID=UPI0035D9595B
MPASSRRAVEGGCDQAEHLGLIAQQRQVGDRLAAVGEHLRKIDGDPARIVAGAARTKPTQDIAEGLREAGGFGEIGQKSRPGVADDSVPIGGDDEPGT